SSDVCSSDLDPLAAARSHCADRIRVALSIQFQGGCDRRRRIQSARAAVVGARRTRRSDRERAFVLAVRFLPLSVARHAPAQTRVTARSDRAGGAVFARDRGCPGVRDRKSTRLNSSHVKISYAVFCLKKKRAAPAAACRSWWCRWTA